WADEGPAPPAEVLAHRRGLGAELDLHQGGQVRRPGPGRRLEGPDVGGEAPELGDEFAVPAGIVDGGRDLGMVAHDPRIAQQPTFIGFGEAGDNPGVEVREGTSKAVALAEYGQPAQA